MLNSFIYTLEVCSWMLLGAGGAVIIVATCQMNRELMKWGLVVLLGAIVWNIIMGFLVSWRVNKKDEK